MKTRKAGDQTRVARRNFIHTTGAAIGVSSLMAALAHASPITKTNSEKDSLMSANEQSPGPHSAQKAPLDVHPGWVRSGYDDTPGPKAYYINLEAKSGKGDLVEQFLRDILAGVEQEPGTGPWFGCRFSETTFGIFEAFPDTAARNAHDVGPGGRNFLRSAELADMLAYPAHLYRLDVLFGKYNVMFGKNVVSG